MGLQAWIALGLWLGAVIVQTLTMLYNGRLARVEKSLDVLHAKASAEGNRRQVFVNEVEVRLGRMDERIQVLTRVRNRN